MMLLSSQKKNKKQRLKPQTRRCPFPSVPPRMLEELKIFGQRESGTDGQLICVSERSTQVGAEVSELPRGSIPDLSPHMLVSPPRLSLRRAVSSSGESVSVSGA